MVVKLETCTSDVPCQNEALAEFWAECMTESGFPTSINEDGNHATETGGRDEEMFEASAFCDGTMNALQPPPYEPSAEYFSGYYDFLLELKGCVEAQGHFVEDPPSREAFIEAGLTKTHQWHPYEHVNLNSEADYAALEELCPQNWTPDDSAP